MRTNLLGRGARSGEVAPHAVHPRFVHAHERQAERPDGKRQCAGTARVAAVDRLAALPRSSPRMNRSGPRKASAAASGSVRAAASRQVDVVVGEQFDRERQVLLGASSSSPA